MKNWLSPATGASRPLAVSAERPSLTRRALEKRAPSPGLRARFLSIGWTAFLRRTFIALVIVPVVLVAAYQAFIATPTYIAEARFAVRRATDRPLVDTYVGASAFDALPSPTADRAEAAKARPTGGISGAAAAGARASQIVGAAVKAITGGDEPKEPYIVMDFISSLEMVRTLDQDRWLRARFSAGDPDWFQALPQGASQEGLLHYWRTLAIPSIDTNTGLINLSVKAFTPEDARAIAEHVIAQCEALLGRIVERGRHDRMAEAKDLLKRAQERYLAAEAAIRDLRSDETMIDPGLVAETAFKQLMELIAARISLDSQLRMIAPGLSDSAPQLKVLKARIAALDAEIERAKAALTDANGAENAAANYLAAFEQRETERLFAVGLYQAALDGVERVRLASERQASYLAVFVAPVAPDTASGPDLFGSTGTTLMVCMLMWGMIVVVAAASRDQLS